MRKLTECGSDEELLWPASSPRTARKLHSNFEPKLKHSSSLRLVEERNNFELFLHFIHLFILIL